jgi:hypothetical protein
MNRLAGSFRRSFNHVVPFRYTEGRDGITIGSKNAAIS